MTSAATIFDKVIVVLSGKGGVGKSSVTAQLAMSLALQGHKVGVLDVDLCGPSIPRIFRLSGQKVMQGPHGWIPIAVPSTLFDDDSGGSIRVMSIGFLLPNPDDAVIWRGPKKNAMIRQFIERVSWTKVAGDSASAHNPPLDYLVIDTPPGTSDEHLAVCEVILGAFAPERKRALIVTTPQLVSLADVERMVVFCRELGVPMAGVLENMSGYECRACGHCTNIFSSGGGRSLAEKYELPFLGRLSINPFLAEMLDHTPASSPSTLEGEDLVQVYAGTSECRLFSTMELFPK